MCVPALVSILLAAGLSPAPPPPSLEIPFEKYTLPNGLEVILHVDRRLPTVTVDVWYHVGAYHETPGRTGFAHLFEHMMFQGSGHVPDDAHLMLVEELGASSVNATTDFDRTNFFETVPTQQLETVLWLESDRMGFLLDSLTQKKLDTQRGVVKNERRETVETAPYGEAEEALYHALFPLPHPFYGQVIGSMKDLDAASLDDVRAFFRRWYAPSNATLTIAGDFDPAQAKRLVERYFGTLRRVPKPALPDVAPAHLDHEIVIRHEERVGKLPELELAWHTPAFFAPGNAAADILALILTDGRASRLERRLVRQGLAQSVHASQESLLKQSIFEIRVIGRAGVTTDALLAAVDAELEDIRKRGVSADEVKRAQNRAETLSVSILQAVGGLGGKADTLQTYNHYLGNPGMLAQDLARISAVTPAEVQAFVQSELRPDRRVVLHAVPAPAQGPGTVPAHRLSPAPAHGSGTAPAQSQTSGPASGPPPAASEGTP